MSGPIGPSNGEQPNRQVRRVLILGGGTAGWMAALAFRRFLPAVEVTVAHSSQVPTIGVGEATTASLPPFLHDDLQLDRGEFYRQVGPSWKLGIRFLWGATRTSPAEPTPLDDDSTHEFPYPFLSTLECPDTFARTNAYYAFEDRARGSLFCELMRRHRSPVVRMPDGRLHLEEAFGYHFDTTILNRFLQKVAADRGVRIVDARFNETILDELGRGVAAVRFDDGRVLEADLFVDSSGFSSLLIGRALGEPFVSFADSLFNDRAVVGSWQRDEENHEADPQRNDIWPYTTAETMDAGWCWRIDLPQRVSRGYVFSSRFASDAEAEAELRRKNPLIDGSVRFVPFKSGRYERTWVGNVVAVGNASGFVEPLESTGLHMAMETIVAMCRSLIDTDRRIVPAMRDVVNRFLGEMWDDVRAFLAVHFRFNRRANTPYWRHCREATNLAAAEPVVDFYRRVGPTQIGHVLLPRQSVFGYRGYLTLLAGQRVETDFRYDMSPGEAEAWRQHVARVAAAADAAFPVAEALRLVVEGKAAPPGMRA